MLTTALLDVFLRRVETSDVLTSWLLSQAQMIDGILKTASKELLVSVQERRLRDTIKYACEHSPYYSRMITEHGIRPSDITSPESFRKLPLTSSKDLRDWRQFLCVDENRIVALYTTSGTTGEPKRMCFTQRDVRLYSNLPALWLRYLCPFPIRAFLALPSAHGLWVGLPSGNRVVEKAGGLPIPIGICAPEEFFQWMDRLSPNILCSSPSYLTALTRWAENTGRKYKLNAIFLGGELLTPDQKAWMESFWGCHVYDLYGTTELGGNASLPVPGCDEMHLNDLHIYSEIIDTRTGEPCDEGELVVTTLLREGMPLLRYRTGDRVRRVECDRIKQLTPVIAMGRLDDVLVTGDMNVSAMLITQAIGKVPGATGRIAIYLDRVKHVDKVVIQVEGTGVQKDKVMEVLFNIYPSLQEHHANGMLLIDIQIDADLGEQHKILKTIDRRVVA